MKLILENHTLKSCLLRENEYAVVLPETIESIDDYAFSQIPSGQIRHLTLPDSLKHLSAYAFSGLGQLSSLTAYTCSLDDHAFREITDEDGRPDYLQAETLNLRRGKGGCFFDLSCVLNALPRRLIVPAGMDIRLGLRDTRELDTLEIEELIVYLPSGSIASDVPVDDHLLRAMSGHLKKLQFLNCRILCEQTRSVKDWDCYRRRVSLSEYDFPDGEWVWEPLSVHLGLSGMHALEELVLPGGLKELPDHAFRDCPSLKKVVFPVSLRTIGKDAFSGCPSLKTMLFSEDNLPKIEPGAFCGCPSLRQLSFYQEKRPGIHRVTRKTDAIGYLEQGRLLSMHTRFCSYLETLAKSELLRRYSPAIQVSLRKAEESFNLLMNNPDPQSLVVLWLSRVLDEVDVLRTSLHQEFTEQPSETDPASFSCLDASLSMLSDYMLAYRAEHLDAGRPKNR